MLNFTVRDKLEIIDAYKSSLLNLRDLLIKYKLSDELDYSKIIIDMMHRGLFSVGREFKIDTEFDYLGLGSDISQGVHVMYGVCCCRHASEFLSDALRTFEFNPSLYYVFSDNNARVWRRVNPSEEKANHVVVLSESRGNKYLIDPTNKFILEVLGNGSLRQIDMEPVVSPDDFNDSNIDRVNKVLKKYYTYREFGVTTVY